MAQQRRSRKRRGQGRSRAPAKPKPRPEAAEEQDAMTSRYARSRERDEAARAALVPLGPGERPASVTAAAIVAGFLGLANLTAYVAGMEVRGERPALPGIVIFTGLMFAAAYGCWRARYWAVLGMQALLALIILIFSLLLIRAESVLAAVIAVAMVGSAGYLFWHLVKAMARIQMPERPS